jgi:formamidopyrimidine-DNA glycosylase
MPELPEVETIRRELARVLIGKKITQVVVNLPKAIRGSVAAFRQKITRAKIKSVGRRAKLAVFSLSNGYSFVVHLKMTGQLIYQRQKVLKVGGHPIKDGARDLPNKFTQVIFRLADGGALFFNDVRKFGFLQLMTTAELENFFQKNKYGPEPLLDSFTLSVFSSLLKKKTTTKIKPLLMDQTFIAGVGNIYATESCFYARLNPTRTVDSLKPQEVKKLDTGLRSILKNAVHKKGTSMSNYVDAYGQPGNYVPSLKVYGREGESCPRCRATIKNITLGGRGTTYCPRCQE